MNIQKEGIIKLSNYLRWNIPVPNPKAVAVKKKQSEGYPSNENTSLYCDGFFIGPKRLLR
jgi:hypothetical protein